MSRSDGQEYLARVLMPLCQHYPSIAFYNHALLVQAETGYSFYDSLVVTATLETGCSVLFTENLQNGRMVQGVKLVNPFVMQEFQ